MKYQPIEKKYSEETRKLHIPCPYCRKTCINVHVVVKEGVCYRSKECMVVECKFNSIQSDIKALVSLVW